MNNRRMDGGLILGAIIVALLLAVEAVRKLMGWN